MSYSIMVSGLLSLQVEQIYNIYPPGGGFYLAIQIDRINKIASASVGQRLYCYLEQELNF